MTVNDYFWLLIAAILAAPHLHPVIAFGMAAWLVTMFLWS